MSIGFDSVAQEVYDKIQPLTYAEDSANFALKEYITGIASMLQEMDEWVRTGENGEVGWSSLVDADRAPIEALAWLGQFVGVTVAPSLLEADKRTAIKQHVGWSRGTTNSIITAAQATLTGAKEVLMIERYTGDPYQLWVATRTAQTPSSAVTLAAIISQKPAGIILTYQTLAGQTFQELLALGTFQTVFTTYATMQGVLTGVPGT